MAANFLMLRRVLAALLVATVAACGGGPFSDGRLDHTLDLGASAGLSPRWLTAGPFVLLSQSRITRPGAPLRLYVEGDGFAYVNRNTPSLDPTPHRPVALELAIRDTAANVAWLARPCQYAMIGGRQQTCDVRYWTTHRMAAPVLSALDRAVSTLAAQAATQHLELVGHSGGGGAVALLAAQRNDVISLRSVAGNLDLMAFTTYHQVPAMSSSLDALSVAPRLRHLPQLVFSGAQDTVVPPALARRYLASVGTARQIVVPGASHLDGWVEQWPTLLRNYPL